MKTSIRVKLGLVIGILLVFILVVGLTAYFQTSYINNKVKEITEVEHKTSETAYQMEINIMETSLAVLKYLQDHSPEHLEKIKEGETQFHEFQQKYFALVQTRQIKELGVKVENSHAKFKTMTDSLVGIQDKQQSWKNGWKEEFDKVLATLDNETYEPKKRFDAHKDSKMRASLKVQAMKVNVNEFKTNLDNYLKIHQEQYEKAIRADQKDFYANLSAQQLTAPAENKERFATAMKKSMKNLSGLADSIIMAEKEKQRMFAGFELVQREFSGLLEEQVLILANKNLITAKDEAMHESERSNMIIGILLAITLLFGTITGIIFARSITRPLKELVGASKKIGETDFSQRVNVRSGDELEVLGNSFNEMATQLEIARQKQVALLKEIELSNKELEDFAHVVSHDLKAPLRGIHTLSEWLASGYGEKLGADGAEQLDLLRGRVKRMFDMIDGVLQYSKVGKTAGRAELIEMKSFIPEIIHYLAVPSSIEVSIQPGMPPIMFERIRLQQLLQNLISNAVKYMDKPNGFIQVSWADAGDQWKFGVADNGPGIPEQFLTKIFKLFQTISPKDEKESTGVGLAIVQKIVETAGGKIWVESKVGEGSIFYFTVPKNAPNIA